MKRGYAVCSAPRSGTNFFCELLTSTGVLGRPREYFNGAARRERDDPSYPDDPRLQIERILTMGATGDVYALKLFPGLFDTVSPHIALTKVLPNLQFVRFVREDVLGQAISWARSVQTQQFRSTEVPKGGSPSYEPETIAYYLRQACQRNARWESYFARTGIVPVTVRYEDVARDPQSGVDLVAVAMGLRDKAIYNPALVPLRVQRDELSAEWRERFLSDKGDLHHIESAETIAQV